MNITIKSLKIDSSFISEKSSFLSYQISKINLKIENVDIINTIFLDETCFFKE
jgi:hypothetical protein